MSPENTATPQRAARLEPGDLVTERDAARILGCSVSTLQNRRWAGLGPPYVKLSKLVRYPRARLTEFDAPPNGDADQGRAA